MMGAKVNNRWFKDQSKLILLVYFAISLFRLFYQFIKINLHARKQLAQARKDISESGAVLKFSEGINFRLWQYTIFHGFLAYLLTETHGREPSKAEMNRFTYLSVCAPLFDDLVDFWYLSESEIRNFLNGVSIDRMPEISLKYAQQYMKRITGTLAPTQKTRFITLLHQLIALQSQKAQSEKGAIAGLLYASLLDNEASKLEEEYLSQLGRIGQYIDDIFDYSQDKRNSVHSWAQDFELSQLADAYNTKIDQLLDIQKELKHQDQMIIKPAYQWNLILLLSSALVAILFFENQAKKGIPISEWPVCDMENWSNRIALFKTAWKTGIASIS